MGLPVVTVASGGLPVGDNTAKGVGMAVTEATYGIPVTKVASGGLGVVYVSATGGAAFTATTWNPADHSANMSLSNGNLTATTTNWSVGVRSITGYSSGKYYLEITMANGSGTIDAVGLGTITSDLTSQLPVGTVGVAGANVWVNGASVQAGWSGFPANGTVVGIAVDLSAQLIWFRAAPSGNWNNSGTANPATATGGTSFSVLGAGVKLYPLFEVGAGTGHAATANFGGSAFSGTVPSGFTAGWPA